MDKALSDVRILDMTHVQAGPTSSQLMAFLGADVIKLESPMADATRKQLRDVPGADSLFFTMLNCNKRSITVNLKNDKGKEAFTKLVESCDVLMENFGPGVLNRLGFGWERVHEINVPCGPVLSTMDLANDEHVKQREMYVEVDHPERGKWFNLGCPIKLSDSPVKIERSPLLGEHTDEILAEVLGYEDSEIDVLKEAGAFTR